MTIPSTWTNKSHVPVTTNQCIYYPYYPLLTYIIHILTIYHPYIYHISSTSSISMGFSHLPLLGSGTTTTPSGRPQLTSSQPSASYPPVPKALSASLIASGKIRPPCSRRFFVAHFVKRCLVTPYVVGKRIGWMPFLAVTLSKHYKTINDYKNTIKPLAVTIGWMVSVTLQVTL